MVRGVYLVVSLAARGGGPVVEPLERLELHLDQHCVVAAVTKEHRDPRAVGRWTPAPPDSQIPPDDRIDLSSRS
eukprot:1241958-Prymnesium_polylepis.1